jgi:hypothetical protein
MAEATKKTTKVTEKTKGAKWAISTLRAIEQGRVTVGLEDAKDLARLEFEIAKFKERRKTNRLLAKIAKALKKG